MTAVVAYCPECNAKASPGFEIDRCMVGGFHNGVHLFCESCGEYCLMVLADDAEAEAA